jgi:hypothetical protein
MDLLDPLFLTALLKIIGVNIILSGDNAVVIAPEVWKGGSKSWQSSGALARRSSCVSP